MLPNPVRALRPPCLALALALTALPSAYSQPTPAAPMPAGARPDPLDAAAAVPAPRLPQALSQYRPLRDEALQPWREANDTVTRIGGWRAYLREAQRPDAPEAPDTPASGARP